MCFDSKAIQIEDILEFEFSCQLILRLLQLLPVIDMFIVGVLNLRLHRLQLGKELHERDRNRRDIQKKKKEMRFFREKDKAFALQTQAIGSKIQSSMDDSQQGGWRLAIRAVLLLMTPKNTAGL